MHKARIACVLVMVCLSVFVVLPYAVAGDQNCAADAVKTVAEGAGNITGATAEGAANATGTVAEKPLNTVGTVAEDSANATGTVAEKPLNAVGTVAQDSASVVGTVAEKPADAIGAVVNGAAKVVTTSVETVTGQTKGESTTEVTSANAVSQNQVEEVAKAGKGKEKVNFIPKNRGKGKK